MLETLTRALSSCENENTINHFRSSPFQGTTPTRPAQALPEASPSQKPDMCSTVDYARTWLTANRFGQFLSSFANYTCQDLLRLSRRDLIDLCGAADGIRLYNALRSHTVKVVYIAIGTEKCMTNHA